MCSSDAIFSSDVCHLTTRDYVTLDIMQNDRTVSEPMSTILRHKLARAIVMHKDQLPTGVAALGCELTYRINDGPVQTRILADREFHGLDRLLAVLPISHPYGLAMLGISEGGRACLCPVADPSETLHVLRVTRQRDAARAARPRQGGPARLRPPAGSKRRHHADGLLATG